MPASRIIKQNSVLIKGCKASCIEDTQTISVFGKVKLCLMVCAAAIFALIIRIDLFKYSSLPYGVGHWDKLSQSTVYELNLVAVVFDNQICHIFSNSMGFKKFVFPKIDCCGIGFSVWQNAIAIVVAAPIFGKENMSVHFF